MLFIVNNIKLSTEIIPAKSVCKYIISIRVDQEKDCFAPDKA